MKPDEREWRAPLGHWPPLNPSEPIVGYWRNSRCLWYSYVVLPRANDEGAA